MHRLGMKALIIYVDDILVSSNDSYEIEEEKTELKNTFQIKDLSWLDVAPLVLSQRNV